MKCLKCKTEMKQIGGGYYYSETLTVVTKKCKCCGATARLYTNSETKELINYGWDSGK